MGNTPEFDWGKLGRLQIGVVLATAVGVGLFFLLWQVMGDAGVEQFPRLIIAMCVPPMLIAVLVGVYILIFRARD
jgi:lipopolysaccharide export LptBFGC system permease protein LptF